MNSTETITEKARRLNCAVVMPTFNNAATIAAVIDGVRGYVSDIIVVNDGSTDNTQQLLDGMSGLEVISYPKNRGKGHALKVGLRAAAERGFRYAITIDSDGQHYPEDISALLDRVEEAPDSLLVGSRNLHQENMPAKNTFANKFSNFWFRLETGIEMEDTQSGYRLYPLDKIRGFRYVTSRYEFELEVLVRAAWKGVAVENVPVRVYYPPEEERVSHFRPARDFTRISVLNTILVIIALTVYYPVRVVRSMSWSNVKRMTRKYLTQTGESNLRISMAIGLGVFWGIVPVWGYQMILAGVTAYLLKLNKVVAVLSSNISIPPMIPLILYGSYVAGGLVLDRPVTLRLSEVTLETVGGGVLQYVTGSFVLAVAAAIVAWGGGYLVMSICRKEKGDE